MDRAESAVPYHLVQTLAYTMETFCVSRGWLGNGWATLAATLQIVIK